MVQRNVDGDRDVGNLGFPWWNWLSNVSPGSQSESYLDIEVKRQRGGIEIV